MSNVVGNPDISKHGVGTQFKKGTSGNPAGRPLGSKNMASLARELLENPNHTIKNFRQNGKAVSRKYPALVLIEVLITLAASGNIQAFRELRRTAYGDRVDILTERQEAAEEWFMSLDQQEQEMADQLKYEDWLKQQKPNAA